jgi:heme-degrading monooxygenase HmoA
MITRIWHGRTSLADADRYLHFLLNDGTKEYRLTPGILSVKVWQRKEEDCCHFWTVTEWSGIDAIKKFAGEDYEKAKYYPEDEGILLEFEEKVIHCSVFSPESGATST